VHLLLLEAQIRILKNRLGTQRIVPNDEERAELLRIGAECNHEVRGVMHIVTSKTYQKWLRERGKGIEPKRSGRPRICDDIRSLVRRMGKENGLWGYRRIVGELKKLGIKIGIMTVARILHEAEIFPDPKKGRRKPPIPWSKFVHAHIDSIVACDFLSKKVWTLRGRVEAYVLVFVHLGTRRAFATPPTLNPNGAWIMQQC